MQSVGLGAQDVAIAVATTIDRTMEMGIGTTMQA